MFDQRNWTKTDRFIAGGVHVVGGVVVGTFGSENGSKSQSRVRVEKYDGGVLL